jgi:hypothetical protein
MKFQIIGKIQLERFAYYEGNSISEFVISNDENFIVVGHPDSLKILNITNIKNQISPNLKPIENIYTIPPLYEINSLKFSPGSGDYLIIQDGSNSI